ncbi:methyl-accepting chemotaxis protein [Candidatus Formimonas warabiya]|uniref:Methyl-accepting chemotaxis protein n=1 Tax=Formimonas warabiya TaxID=1761012 RepID=A0A3G1KUG6_FORW1|nr:methyl-accepting chemotaxis protein [Candidatus Formimonas warabiya]ATW26099.1 methyl-accepting chemotaxis protein [Candidatus Formimonas warabiya]
MKWFYNLRISVKLLAGFFIVAIIAGAIGVIGVKNIKEIESLDTDLYEKMTAPLGELVTITESYQRMRGNVRDIILASTPAEFDDYENSIKLRNDEFASNLESFKKTLLSDEGAAAIKDLEEAKANYDEEAAKIIELARANKDQEAILLLKGDAETATQQMEDALKLVTDLKVQFAKEAAGNNTQTANAATRSTVILLIVGVILALVLGIFISSSISRPVKKIVAAANKIAQGDLNVNVDIQTKDEIGILAASFRTMTENMNNALSHINAAAEQVASGAKQVSASSMALSQGATEQASSIEELTASLEEISSQTNLNAQHAGEANTLAEIAQTNALQGNDQMKSMLKAMEEINDASCNISKIIKVIDEIAFQTNILALNAAVEAARAGQHGKGFAVVAEEVRNLAARSANAAKETTDMIEGSIKKVEGGTKIAHETAAALNQIVENVAKVTGIVGNIAAASNEQAAAIGQVNQGIMQVSQVVQTNSATSEESAAASEELSSQAELLKGQVNRFKLKRVGLSSYKELEEINPDVLRVLEGMAEKKKKSSPDIENYEEAAAAKPKLEIALSDKEFGKY